MIIQIIMLILLLVAAPLGTGLIMNSFMEENHRSLGLSYISGFLMLLAVFQLITVPIVFLEAKGFPLVVKSFTCVSTILTGLGIVISLHNWRKGNLVWKVNPGTSEKKGMIKIQWLIVLVLIGFQIFMSVTRASFDGDDAYYVVQSVMTDETNTLYRILPYTGGSTSIDLRHSMAVFPIWIAYIARMTGIHATILCHSVLPIVLIPITYWIYLEVGKKLFWDKQNCLPSYMMFVCMLQIFGNVSIYPNATFFLMRTWQGKSMLANVVIPAIFMILLWLFEGEPTKRKKRTGFWILLFIVNLVAAMMSTASVFLNVFLIGIMTLVLAWQEKNVRILFKMALTCLPCVVYGLVYVLV